LPLGNRRTIALDSWTYRLSPQKVILEATPMKRFASALLIPLLYVAFAAAQNPPAPPKPAPELKKLDYFTGTWRLTGDMKASPFGPAGKMVGTEHNEWMQGGFFLLSHSDESSPMGKAKGLAIFGYDSDGKAYTYQAYNSMGEAESARGTLEGNIWTWTNEMKMEGKVIRGRFTVKTTSPTAYDFKFEMAPEGGDWTTVMEGKATKATTAPPAKK
jgi:Protein of unknown function (DUF1579)